MTTLRQRQKSGWDIVLHHYLLLKTVIERRMKGRKKPGRPTEMLLDWLMKKGIGNVLFAAKEAGRRQN